jgi:hypothetical protein
MGLYDTVNWKHEGLPEEWQTKDLAELMDDYEIKDNHLYIDDRLVTITGALRLKSGIVHVDLLLLRGKIISGVEVFPKERILTFEPKEGCR